MVGKLIGFVWTMLYPVTASFHLMVSIFSYFKEKALGLWNVFLKFWSAWTFSLYFLAARVETIPCIGKLLFWLVLLPTKIPLPKVETRVQIGNVSDEGFTKDSFDKEAKKLNDGLNLNQSTSSKTKTE